MNNNNNNDSNSVVNAIITFAAALAAHTSLVLYESAQSNTYNAWSHFT